METGNTRKPSGQCGGSQHFPTLALWTGAVPGESCWSGANGVREGHGVAGCAVV